MPDQRTNLYIWVTWLSKLLTGENSCEWASWFKARHERGSHPTMPSTFDLANWQIGHTAAVTELRDRLDGEGRTVYIEN